MGQSADCGTLSSEAALEVIGLDVHSLPGHARAGAALPLLALKKFEGVQFEAQNWFDVNTLSNDGRYRVQLCARGVRHQVDQAFTVEIDDYIPCMNGVPVG